MPIGTFAAWGRTFATLLKVVAVLSVIDWWVRGPFFANFILSHYVRPFAILRERTSGQNLSILVDAIKRLPQSSIRVAFLGDSTMKALDGGDQAILPYFVSEQLRNRFPGARLEVVDCSEIGLYGGDAALLTSRILGAGIDVVVYGVVLRALPRHPETRWVTHVSSEMGLADLGRLIAVGGSPWLVRNLSSDQVIGGLVHSSWDTYAYRSSLRWYLWEAELLPILAPHTWPQHVILPPVPVQPETATPPARDANAVMWPRGAYGPPNANWEAVELFARLCERYLPGGCVLFTGPVNPVGRDRIVERGLYDEYLAFLRVVVGRSGLIWRDYTDALGAEDFLPPKLGRRDPIHMNAGGRLKLSKLLIDPVAEAVATVRRHGDERAN